jgi:hypothetical protein
MGITTYFVLTNYLLFKLKVSLYLASDISVQAFRLKLMYLSSNLDPATFLKIVLYLQSCVSMLMHLAS